MAAADKAVVLSSGGLDSTTVLAIARADGFDCFALSLDYGQRHRAELAAAAAIARDMAVVEHKVITLNLDSIGGSALTDPGIAVPEQALQRTEPVAGNIPVTYVPARNTVFLSIALGWAEVLQARHLFIGVNAVDYSGYPDCRPDYIRAYQAMANLATRAGVSGQPLTIHTPLMELGKGDIIRRGMALGIDYSLTVSCYQASPEGLACGACDSCRLRRQGFAEAGTDDPTRYL